MPVRPDQNRSRLSRRDLLRGAGGIALALPLLTSSQLCAQPVSLPKRLCLFFVPEGTENTYWWPTNVLSPTSYSLDTSLSPLAGNRADLTIVKGLNMESTKPIRTCYHGFCLPHVLTGGPLGPSITFNGLTSPGGISVDRFLGQHLKGPAPFQTYEFGVQTRRADLIKQRLSYDSAGAGRDAQNNPYTVFTELFGGAGPTVAATIEAQHRRRMSVLDLLGEDITRVRCAVGSDGAQKMDAHLQSVRTMELQLQALYDRRLAATNATVDAKWTDPLLYQNMARYPEVGKLQMDLLAAAFASDLTRVATLQWSHTVSRQLFPWLPVNDKTGNYHDAIAHNGTANALADRKVIYAWYAEQFRYLIEKLKSIPEGAGSVFDNTVVVYFSEMSFGNSHSPDNIPVIIAGTAQGALRNGLFLDLTATKPRSFNDLLLTLCQAMGVPVSRFGEQQYCTGAIAQLLT